MEWHLSEEDFEEEDSCWGLWDYELPQLETEAQLLASEAASGFQEACQEKELLQGSAGLGCPIAATPHGGEDLATLPSPWALAAARAAQAAEAYALRLHPIPHTEAEASPSGPGRTAATSGGPRRTMAISWSGARTTQRLPAKLQAPAAAPRPLHAKAPATAGHQEVMEEVMGLAAGKCNGRTKGALVEVQPGREYDAVTGYFLETLGRAGVEVRSLSRIASSGRATIGRRGAFTVMFHGCRVRSNEDSIITNGFQVSRCVSGGRCFGTWFAYGAAYSDGGFVSVDGDGERRIFVCAVANEDVKLDDETMRVVRQGRAYPVWLLRYWYPDSRRYGRQTRASRPPGFYVVHDGAWVFEASLKRQEEEKARRQQRQQEEAQRQQQGPLALLSAALK